MARSGSIERGVPAVFVLSPLAISFAALQPGLWGWDWCAADACRPVADLVSWMGVGFPHALAYTPAILGLGAPGVTGLVAVADLLLAMLALRFLPPRLSRLQATAVLVGWLTASLLAVLAEPYIMVSMAR